MTLRQIGVTAIALCLAITSAARAGEDRCERERAERDKIHNLELPARAKAIQEKDLELTLAVEDSIGVDKKIEVGKQAGVAALVLDGYAKESTELRAKIERLKADLPKRRAEAAALRQHADDLDVRIGQGCPPELLSKDDWQAAIGMWENKARTLVIEFVDMNKANREYYPSESAKVEGYVRKVPSTWPTDRVKVGDLLFISSTVEGNVLSGSWLTLPAKGECTSLPPEQSAAALTVDVASQTLTAAIQMKQYWTPKCAWSDKAAADTILFHRAK